MAVVPVLLYHALVPAWPGGFLGVDVFFVISGYLITSILRKEHLARGAIGLRAFYLRRARRLLPAVYTVVAAVVLYALLVAEDARAGLRGNVVAAFFYVTNWWQILADQSYFETSARGPLLNHLWSLAVEEQFYVVWPALMIGIMRLRARKRAVAIALVIFATNSALLMRLLYAGNAGDPTDIFVRTDTRASGLLLGAALAFVWSPAAARAEDRGGAHVAWIVDAIALGGFAVLGWAYTHVNDFDSWVYRGGFFVIGVASVAIVAASVHPRSRLARLLGIAPLRYIGTRSYGIYLWHWPVFQATRPGIDLDVIGSANLALRLGLTLALAEASYRWVESPIRAGAIGRALAAARGRDRRRRAHARRRLTLLTAACTTGAVGLFGALSMASIPQDAPLANPTCPAVPARAAVAVGSSVMAAATSELRAAMPTLAIDAAPRRSWPVTLALVDQLAATRRIDILVAEFGAGENVDPATMSQLQAALPDAAIVVAPSGPNATRELRASLRSAETVVFDWWGEVGRHRDWHEGNRRSLTPAGAKGYADGIAGAIASVAGDRWFVAQPARRVASELECTRRGLPAAIGIGDSIMDRARAGLSAGLPDLLVAAAGNRTIAEARRVIDEFAASDRLPDIVVLHIGSAHPFTDDEFNQLMAHLADIEHVVIVNVRAKKASAPIVNDRIARLAPRYDNVTIADWAAYAAEHDEWFTDGAHLTRAGQNEYAAFLETAISAVAGRDWQDRATW